MGILDGYDFDNIPEEQPAPEGEYEVRIISAEEYTGKDSGKKSIRLMLAVEGQSDCPPVFDYWSLPSPDDDKGITNRKLRRIRDGLAAFGLPKDADFSEWTGAVAWALLGVEADNRGEPRNTVKRYIATSRDNTPF